MSGTDDARACPLAMTGRMGAPVPSGPAAENVKGLALPMRIGHKGDGEWLPASIRPFIA